MVDVPEEEEQVSRIVAVVGGAHRRDRWLLATETQVVCVLSRAHLDLRAVECQATEVHISVRSALGGVTLLVPDGTDVRLSGSAFLGSSHCSVAPSDDPSGLPPILVTATTVLGRIRVCSPGTLAAATARRRRGATRRAEPEEPVAEAAELPPVDVNAELPPLPRVAPAIEWDDDEDDDAPPPDISLRSFMGAPVTGSDAQTG